MSSKFWPLLNFPFYDKITCYPLTPTNFNNLNTPWPCYTGILFKDVKHFIDVAGQGMNFLSSLAEGHLSFRMDSTMTWSVLGR